MRIGTKILLLMLLITAGSSAVITWIVTLTVTRYETQRVNDQISLAIERYGRQLENQQQRQISPIVLSMLEQQEWRSFLQAADDPNDTATRENFRQTFLGDLQIELSRNNPPPAFHVLANQAQEVLVTAAVKDPKLQAWLAEGKVRWPVSAVLGDGSGAAAPRHVMQYITSSQGLYLAMGVPLHEQLDQPPTHAYFVGYRIDDKWVASQLLADESARGATTAPLSAWFLIDGKVVASGSADPADASFRSFGADTAIVPVAGADSPDGAAGRVQFSAAGEHYLGQSFNLGQTSESSSRLVLGSSLDRALAPLRRLQRVILLVALATCAVAFIACRLIASMISRPIRDLVAGTQRVATGRFDTPVPSGRRDELGKLADSFNQMSDGLKERDRLRESRVKTERDLAMARKIQLDILPKELPPCPGYDLAVYSLPAEATGGDIYDLVTLALDPPDLSMPPDPSLVLLLADATGHGIGPALSVTQVRSMLRIGVRLRAGLEAVFSQINRQLCQDLGSGRFVTAFLGLLDPNRHVIDYHSAGQGPLLHFHAATGDLEWIGCSMLPLGVMEDAMSEGVKTMHLSPGDLVVLLTDGFYEYRSRDEDLFGQDRVAEIILRHRACTPRQVLDEILAAIGNFGQDAQQLDDMTAIIIKRKC